jgi:beta-galactosidase
MYFPKLIHGCDYNPEQWLHRPDILKRDVELMAEAGINLVSLGVFSWAHHEPREGEYRFDWLDAAFDRLHAAGVEVCLATGTAAYPVWMAQRYPEIVRTDATGKRNGHGRRHDFCWTSPVYREKSAALIDQLARRYRGHPALHSWHINNEYGGAPDNSRCYCPLCVASFQRWLQARYHDDIDALNLAWWTSFWSRRYTAWDQIIPANTGIGALMVNWQRFCSEQAADFLRHEIRAVRARSDAPVTTNLHGNGKHVDDALMARELDFVGFDHYPPIDGTERDLLSAIDAGWEGDRMRCLKHQPWLLLESCPSQPQYFPHMRAKRPGVHRLLSLQHIAHGSEGVCYFQWRAGRGGIEKLHGAITTWDAPERTRVFGEVAEVGDNLKRMAPLSGANIEARIAFVWDVHAEWHFAINSGLNNIEAPRQRALRWYGEFWKANLPVDVIHPGDPHLENYSLILVPGLILAPAGLGERLRRAAERGATIVGDPLTAWLDEDHLMLPGGRLGPELRALFGVECEEFDCLRKDETVAIASSSPLLPAQSSAWEICDLVNLRTATALAEFAGDFYRGRPALTKNTVGRGAAYYVCATLGAEALRHFVRALCAELGLHAPLAAIPEGLQVRRRAGADGIDFLVVSNFADAPRMLELGRTYRDVLRDGAELGGRLELAPREVRVLAGGG